MTNQQINKEIEEIVEEFEKRFGFRAYDPNYTDPEDFIRQALLSHTKAVEERVIANIDKVYKREGGINNWLDLRSFLSKKE